MLWKLILEFGGRVWSNFDAHSWFAHLLIRNQVAQFLNFDADVLASLLQFPLERVEVAPVAAKVSGCGDSLLGVGFGAVDQFNAFEGLGGCHSVKPQVIFFSTVPRTLRSIDLSKGMKNPVRAACYQFIIVWDSLPK